MTLSLTLTGCFGEDYSFCPPDQRVVTLHFRLPNPIDNSGDTFKQYINGATTAIYDAEGNLVQVVESDETTLEAFQGLRLNLAPGTYKVVSWGNSGGLTHINALNTPLDVHTYLDYRTLKDGRIAGTGDPLYYGPNSTDGIFEFTVDPEKGYTGTVDFRHAHRNVEVYVEGFKGSDNSTTPTVRLTGLPAGLDFVGMGRIDQPDVDAQAGSRMGTYQSTLYALSDLTTFYFGLKDYTIGVELLDPATGAVVYTTTLNKHINPDTDDPKLQRTLQLFIDLSGIDVAVSVKVPAWGNEDNVDWDYL